MIGDFNLIRSGFGGFKVQKRVKKGVPKVTKVMVYFARRLTRFARKKRSKRKSVGYHLMLFVPMAR